MQTGCGEFRRHARRPKEIDTGKTKPTTTINGVDFAESLAVPP